MAAANPLQNLLEEASCPICLGPFKDPVITPCVHNFCRSCITGCSREPGLPLCCPQCREPCSLADLKPNRQLQSIVELVSQLSAQPQRPPMGGGVCVDHAEGLKLFCDTDRKLICVICQVSSEHQWHRVRPVGEAARDYQGKLQNWLPPLQKERDAIVASKRKLAEKSSALRGNLQAERVKATAEFKRMHQLLREQEQTVLERLEEMDRKITTVENANIAKLSNQISSLNTLIKEIETKCEQSPEELLEDVGLALSRCENVKLCEPQEKIEKTERQEENNTLLELEQFEPLMDLKRYKVLVTLDPETAHQRLGLPAYDRRRMQRSLANPSFRPKSSRTLIASLCVLGKEGFSSGKSYWEVELLQDGLEWAVGVAYKSFQSKMSAHLQQISSAFSQSRLQGSLVSQLVKELPKATGIWAVSGDQRQYFAMAFPCTALKPRQTPKKLGVYLDYEAGQVSLYNGDTMEALHTFHCASFKKPVHPYFYFCSSVDAARHMSLTDVSLV